MQFACAFTTRRDLDQILLQFVFLLFTGCDPLFARILPGGGRVAQQPGRRQHCGPCATT